MQTPDPAGVPLERSLPGPSFTREAEFARERDGSCSPTGSASGAPRAWPSRGLPDRRRRGESIIVARADDGGLAGFYNLCRHRGSRLVPDGRRASRRRPARGGFAGQRPLPLPRLDLRPRRDAARRAVPARRCASYRAALALHPVDVATWGGFVFARLEPAAATAAPAGRPAGAGGRGRARRRLPAGRPALRRPAASTRSPPTGRSILENYNECYHCGPVHPELCELVPGLPPRRRRRGLGRRASRTAPGRHVHVDRDHPPRAVPRPARGGADPALRRTGAAQPDAQPVRRPRGRVHRVAPVGRATTVLCDFLFHPDEMARAGLRPLRRGRLLGPGEPPGLVHLRAGPGRHELAPVHGRLPGPDGTAQRRRRPVRRRPAGHERAGAGAGQHHNGRNSSRG